MSENFSKNLRALCSEQSSIAQACRDIGINRQQFNRYLNGGGMPSAHNLRRIALHFDISESQLMIDHALFVESRRVSKPRNQHNPAEQFNGLFSKQSGALRRYLGFYNGHFMTPTWKNNIMRTLIWLREKDGFVVSHTFERALSSDKNIVQKTRYSGLATYRGNRIYLIETANSEDGFVSESIMFPAHRQQVKYLRGMTIGVATHPRLAPYSSPTIWKKLPEKISAREALTSTGIFGMGDTRIDPFVRNYFDQSEAVALKI